MIVMLNERVIYSTLYGREAQKELQTLRKKFRQGREVVQNEGHPVDEHMLVVTAKLDTLRMIAPSITREQFNQMQATKRAQQKVNVAAFVMPAIAAMPFVEEGRFGTYKKERSRRRRQQQETEED